VELSRKQLIPDVYPLIVGWETLVRKMIDRFNGQVRRDVAELSGDILASILSMIEMQEFGAAIPFALALVARMTSVSKNRPKSLALSVKVHAKVKVILVTL
jgi:hypothetical protein